MADPISTNIGRLSERHYKVLGTVTVGDTLAESTSIDYRRYASGNFTAPTGTSLTTLTWWSSHEDVTASFTPAYTQANAAVTQTVAQTRRYPIPAELAGAHYIRAVGNADGTVTNVVLKF